MMSGVVHGTRAWAAVLCAAAALGGCAESTNNGSGDATTDTADAVPEADQDIPVEAPEFAGDDVVTGDVVDEETPCLVETVPKSETQVGYIVPPYVRYMVVKAWGSGGNGEAGCSASEYPNGNGGIGGFSAGVFEVEPGTPLIIIVGAPGSASVEETPAEERMRFGWGNDGGGGLSGVFLGPDLLTEDDYAKALVVAGGGGGATTSAAIPCNPGNNGNIDLAAENQMANMQGGQGSDDGVNGGAGGYRGGRGGNHDEPGYGGLGFVAEPNLGSAVESAGAGDDMPPRSDDADYQAYVTAEGKMPGVTETEGLVIISFVCEIPPII